MQYTLSLNARMLTLAGLCLVSLFVLLFLLGVEIGKKMVEPEVAAATTSIAATAASSAASASLPDLRGIALESAAKLK